LRTALIVIVGSLTAAMLVMTGSLAGSLRLFVLPLQFLVVLGLLLASSIVGRKG